MKWLKLTLLFAFISSIGMAQNFKGSAYAGATFSHMRGDYMVGYNKPGANLGLTVAYPFHKNFDVSMSLSFSQKGSRATYDRYGNRQGGSWHLMRANYVEIPILINYRISLFDKDFILLGGLSIARLMSESLKFGQFTGVESDKILRTWEYAFQLGAAYVINDNLNIFIRHSTSVISVAKGDISFFFSPYNVGLINLAASFGIERKF
ncbi:MAG: PorT family protein [Bacteroidia bacterium]